GEQKDQTGLPGMIACRQHDQQFEDMASLPVPLECSRSVYTLYLEHDSKVMSIRNDFGWTEGDENWREATPGCTFFDSLSRNRQSHLLRLDGLRKGNPCF